MAIIAILASLVLLFMAPGVKGASLELEAQQRQILAKLKPYLGVPYRNDGALNTHGEYTTFAKPTFRFKEPGLNCSGFLVDASRKILGQAFPLKDVMEDQNGNSGPGSPYGEDWDFGHDLVFNILKGKEARTLVGGPGPSRGMNIADQRKWEEILPLFRPGHLYYAALSKPTKRRGYTLMFYHVGLLVTGGRGEVWFYHTTRKSNTHRFNIASRAGMRQLQYQFSASSLGPKYMSIYEVAVP